ncbi:helix-turn-helix transcriptional regulator [Nocardia sp. CDC192]|uniref:helix-turn-helix domain-containing protein n=1 Tax=Nocardia implantans TaxID=3108168 RepID=UPI002B052B43|nr:helix-turn-helix transcriptional regulator [Nocardia sp. CDC192]MEA3532630.1 helix-turn-helix transcriptional regulator [Nocardia sp. CDC192]
MAAEAGSGSTIPRRLLARQLRALRDNARVSSETARKEIGVSQQTFWRMETGQPVKINRLFIEHLCKIYGTDEKTKAALLALRDEAQNKSWWHAYSDAIPKDFDLFVGLEQAASSLVGYQPTLLPGLLQTTEYRQALIWVERPNISTAYVNLRLELASRRRDRITSRTAPLNLDVIVNEAALRHAVGGAAVMESQLHHLASVGSRPNVSVRIVPIDARTHPGLFVGAFTILEFPPHKTTHLTEPPVVYVEGYTGDLYLEKGEEVAQYRKAFSDIERSALSREQSRNLFLEIAEEYARGR